MPEKPKRKKPVKKKESGKSKPNESSSWEADQSSRGYYYDDAHGYEVFDTEKDADEDESDALDDDGL